MKILKLIMLLLITTNCYSNNKNEMLDELKNLSQEQKTILHKTLKHKSLSKQERLLYSAIAWKESEFGKHIVNKSSGDYGVFQININTFNKRFKNDFEYAGLTKYSKRLLKNNYSLNLGAAKAEISYWKKRHKGDLSKTIASYNDGSIISHIGKKYSKDIIKRMSIIENYVREEKI